MKIQLAPFLHLSYLVTLARAQATETTRNSVLRAGPHEDSRRLAGASSSPGEQASSSGLAAGAAHENLHDHFAKVSHMKVGDISDEELHRNRALEVETCNVPYQTMSVEEIKATLTAVFQGKVDRDIQDAQNIIDNYIPLIEHDVQFVRVCQSCESQNLSGYGCELDDYGYDVTHSGLVIVPVVYDPNDMANTSIINTKKLKPWFHFKALTFTQQGAHATVYSPGFETWEYAVLAASLGYVSIVPDKSGYGTASGLVNTDIVRKTLFTSTVPIYSFAKSYVDTLSNGHTKLEKKAVYMGATVGGYAAVAVADSFKTHYDIDPIMVLASSTPFFMRSFPLSLVLKLDQSTLAFSGPTISISMALVFLAYSKTRPGMENSDAGQSFVRPERTNYFMSILQDPDAISPFLNEAGFLGYFFANYPEAFGDLKVLDPSMVAFYQDAIARDDPDPCKNSSVDDISGFGMEELCAALDANDLTDIFEEAEFPVQACHSDMDEFVPYDSIPEEILAYTINDIEHALASSHCFPLLMNKVEIEKPKIKSPKAPKTPKGTKAEKAGKKK